ncbi:MAG: STAS/SEC14 domain-containing protein [Myxococcota bacterium]
MRKTTNMDEADSNDFLYDLSALPIVFVRYPKEASLEAIEQAFEFYVELSQKHRRVAYLFDLRDFNPVTASAKLRRAFADHYEANRSVIEPATVAEALVHSSTLVRGIVTAVNWLTVRAYPQRQFTDMDKARDWLLDQLARDGASNVSSRL